MSGTPTDESAPGLALRVGERGVRIGISAWTEPTLLAAHSFYPQDAHSAETRLRYYASQFPLVEVDATYYAPLSERVAQLWVERTPVDFRFDVKAYRLLTHHPTPPSSLWSDLRAELPAEVAAKRHIYGRDVPYSVLSEVFTRFVAALTPLREAGRLGVVLFQFPRYFYPSTRSNGYLAWLVNHIGHLPVGIEFRQHRWMDAEHRDRTLGFLRDCEVNYVCVDEPQGFSSSIPPIAAATAELGIVRFHGRNSDTWQRRGLRPVERFAYRYTRDELADWVPKIGQLHEGGRPVHVLMNNCHGDDAVHAARLMAELLDEAGIASGASTVDSTHVSDLAS